MTGLFVAAFIVMTLVAMHYRAERFRDVMNSPEMRQARVINAEIATELQKQYDLIDEMCDTLEKDA